MVSALSTPVVRAGSWLAALDAGGVSPPDEQDTAATVLITKSAISDGVRQFITDKR
jgi:hypothetical protein